MILYELFFIKASTISGQTHNMTEFIHMITDLTEVAEYNMRGIPLCFSLFIKKSHHSTFIPRC